MPANQNNDKPSVDFNFDAWEQPDKPKPFGVVIGGKRYEAINPLDLDYREFDMVQDDPDAVFRMLFPEHHTEILANKHIKAGALREFQEQVMEHYGLGNIAAP